ncbi:tRNA-dihydrouridine(20) synthase [NAD(P)+]-like [Strongyloides ratti]|uniref:tRNA-dihydrouridine(20) synthase [NAD(P)+]-like n=1 Tax=Strongyloides ratti TaxID=34506 RepID=A0A090L3L2_STRRB|nr:tRNA-dihydrouridine(20) synthase [NAD(P)+]-like [Strongyloides ratti]CEF64401.1 tRNA-dihydrouridine(20) synthase [NAD(P)+]-like [Strongyloides ratti]
MSNKGFDLSHYAGKICLAPMVRAGRTPLRLLSLDYGADLVYTEEIVDKRLITAKRIENKLLNTIDYVNDAELVLRIAPEEKGKLVLQIGTDSPERSCEVINKVVDDISSIDINMGCPKPFSILGGMGAALLSKPELAKEILESLVSISKVPVSAKIRVLNKREDTLEFAKMVQRTGVSAIGVHGRRRDERPNDKNRIDEIKEVVDYLDIPVLANGESGVIKEYKDIERFKEKTGASGVLLGRIALSNPSIFRKEGLHNMETEIINVLEKSCMYDEPFTQCKYVLSRILGSQLEFDPRAWGVEDRYYYWKKIHQERDTPNRKRKLEEEKDSDITFHDITFPMKRLRMCKSALTPKCFIRNYCFKEGWPQPTFTTWKRESDGRWEALIEVNNQKHQSRIAQMNRRMAEQVSALCAIISLGIRDELEGEWEE